MGSRKSALREERGVTLVLMALMLFLAMGMSALAIDYGMIKSAKAEAQRAMDAAALAGASAFLISDPAADIPAIAEARARDFAKKHDVHRLPVTDPEVTVVVDVPNTKVTASYISPGIPLWFASIFGTSTMGITALAAAHVEEAGEANCVKPVAIPDIWDNKPNPGTPTKKNPNPPDQEDINGDHLWNYVDRNNNGKWDDGETEPWRFTTGDVYDPASNGYGTTFRNQDGSGIQAKTKDYGRQMILMTFSSKDDVVSSMFYAWGQTTDDNGAVNLAARIRGNSCDVARLDTKYAASNGGKVGQVESAWEDLINEDPNGRWDDSRNTVVNSSGSAQWLDQSPRVIIVGLYDPSKYSQGPQDNGIKFNNLAKVWIDQRPCSGQPPGQCKQPITARFLGYLGGGPGGPDTGSLVKRLVLIK